MAGYLHSRVHPSLLTQRKEPKLRVSDCPERDAKSKREPQAAQGVWMQQQPTYAPDLQPGGMEHQELYGNWLCPPPFPGKKLVRQTGIYHLQGRPVSASHFRSDSPDSFDNEEDYDDVSMSEVGEQMLQRHPAHAQNTDATSPGGTGVYVLAGKPASLSPPRTADPLPDSNHGKGHRAKSIMTLYVLMGICFAMWAVLLSVAVVKYSEMSEELKGLNYNYSEMLTNVLQALADARTEREEIQSNMNKSYKELWDIAESICSALPEPLRCHAGWKKFEKACYFFSNMTGDWTWAKQFCVDQKSHLVSVNTDEEQAFLKEHSESDKTYWLGLSDAMEEGRWQWVDQSTYSTSFWYIEGPDSKREEEDCASMRPSGMWDDSNCSQPNYWICEKKWIC